MPTIEPASVDEAAVAAFLAEHLDDMHAISPPCSVHALVLDGFRDARVRLWVAREGERVVGSVAVVRLDAGDVELKSMRVAASVRGTGLGRALLEHAIAEALVDGATRMSLETGTHAVFAPARALYASHGFVECEPFGTYVLDRESVFMTRELVERS